MSEKINVYGLDGSEKESIDLPDFFGMKPRLDLISRAIIAHESNQKQPQGRDLQAGKRTTAYSWGSGFGVARPPRNKGSGYSKARNAAFIPGVVDGRVTHPPRTIKKLSKKINSKERKLALISGAAATGDKNLVKRRGHIIDEIPGFPLIVDDKIQGLKKTSDVIEVLSKLGIEKDIQRVKDGKNIRAGKGKRRGRKYKVPRGLLIVIKEDFGIVKAARNIEGVDVVNIKQLNCYDLSPGGIAGRLTLWAQSSLSTMKERSGN